MLQAISAFDSAAMLFIQEHIRCGVLTPIMIFFTTLGEAGMVWLLLSAVLLCFKKTRRTGFLLLLSVAICYVINDWMIKPVVGRPRPFLAMEGLVALTKAPGELSFPSGHTCASFAAALALTKCWGKRGAWFYILAVLIAVSRPYVGVHYVTDIVAGAIVGTLGTLAIFAVAARIEGRKTARAEENTPVP